YVLNQVIKTVPDVTTVALMHGYTMGGGCGLSQHADLRRLVTEDVEWAMPECTLGLVPDVGSTFFLNELPDGVGRYLALTGTRLNAKEMMLCKLATHYIAWGQVCATPYTLHPTPYTRHPTCDTLHPTPYMRHPKPYILHPTPYTRHPTPYALNVFKLATHYIAWGQVCPPT
ncbi:ClpP/crotonase-like domain-containing protein, partial [Baffinella frigidus]